MADDKFIESPPAGLEGWRDVWRGNLRYTSAKPPTPVHRLVSAFLSLIDWRYQPDKDRQRDFNVATLDLLGDIRSDLDALRRDLGAIRADLMRDVETTRQDLVRSSEALGNDIRIIRETLPKRNDALVEALDRKIEALAARTRDVTNRVITAPPATLRDDFIYRRLEDGLRGSTNEVREAMRPYLEYARTQQPVIDAGCGRGEFLALCREAGVDARGFDTNERSVADLEQQGFDVELLGVPECFEKFGDGAVGSILAAHVVEHLSVRHLIGLFHEATRVLRRGGLLMIETPNAQSLAMSASDFWRDPTHLAPRHVAALSLLAREFGFKIAEVRTVHPLPEGNRLPLPDGPLRATVERLNDVLFGDQDLRLVLEKN